jgi:hypothetical protein
MRLDEKNHRNLQATAFKTGLKLLWGYVNSIKYKLVSLKQLHSSHVRLTSTEEKLYLKARIDHNKKKG